MVLNAPLVNGSWNVVFFRNLNDWQLELANDLFVTLAKYKMDIEKWDVLKWKRWNISAKSCYELLCSRGQAKAQYLVGKIYPI